MLKRSRTTSRLSPQQRCFAEQHGDSVGDCVRVPERAVFVYRDEGWRTCRWLVDPGGRVVDFVSLRRTIADSQARFVRPSTAEAL